MKKLDKILSYIENHSITNAEFERKSGISNGYLKNTEKRGEDITQKILDRIKKSNSEDYFQIFPEEKTSIPLSIKITEKGDSQQSDYLTLYLQSLLEQKNILEDKNRILEEHNVFLRRNFEISLNSIVKGQDAVLLQLKTISWFQVDTRAGGDQKKAAVLMERMGKKANELAGISEKKDIPTDS